MTLTSEYQFVGRSNYVPSNADWYNYYILLYAKTVEDIATGRHTVYVKQRLACDNGFSFYGYHTRTEISVDGTVLVPWEWEKTPNTQWNGTVLTEDGVSYPMWIDLREVSTVIPVGYGETKDIRIESRWDFGGDSTASNVPVSYWAANVNATVTLPMIAGISLPTVSDSPVELGAEVTIYTNRIASSGFTHTLEYRFGNASGLIAEGVEDAFVWSPDISLASQIPNAVSGVAVITCTTYAGDTAIGSKQVTVTLTVPESVIPTAAFSYSDTSGARDLLDTFVQHISKISVDASGGKGAYGSTITAVAITLNEKAYNGGLVTESGFLPLTVNVTDSRERQGSSTVTVWIAPYSVPALTLSASRCLADGTADDTGDHAKITVTGFITDVNSANRAVMELNWGAEPETVDLSAGDIFYQKIIYADPNATVAIAVKLADRLVETSRSMILSTGYATLDLLAGGKGISFGKAATREGFDCAMPAFFSGGLYSIDANGVVDTRSLFDRVAALEAKL